MPGIDIRELNSLKKWTGSTINYSFLEFLPSYYDPADPEYQSFQPFSQHQNGALLQGAVLQVLGLVEEITGIQFQFVQQTASNVGDITFGLLDLGAAAGGETLFPGLEEGGDVWFNTQTVSGVQSFGPGTQFFGTAIHEIGHALGLKHPALYQAEDFPPFFGGVEATEQYTMMSIDRHPEFPGSYEPDNWMLYDIAMLQFLYNQNLTTRNTDTIYNNWGYLELFSIWDGGGNDTFSAEGKEVGAYIDLRQGRFSSITDDINYGGFIHADNVSIAFGTVIENAVGSSHDDWIVGNEVNNSLVGGNGNDLIYGDGEISDAQQANVTSASYQHTVAPGSSGNDTIDGGKGDDELYGGAGNDLLIGGEGKDQTRYDYLDSGITITEDASGAAGFGPGLSVQVNGSQDNDFLVGIEEITGTDQADTVAITDFKAAVASGVKVIDLGDAPLGQNDVADFSQVPDTQNLKIDKTVLNQVVVRLEDDPESQIIVKSNKTIQLAEGGAGNDTLSGGGGGVTLAGGAGDDVLREIKANTELFTGIGNDSVTLSSNVLYHDLSPDDRVLYMDQELTGAIRRAEAETPGARNGLLIFGKNQVGELIIEDPLGGQTFIAGPQVDPTTPGAERTAGILIGELFIEFNNLLADDQPKGWFTDFHKTLLGDYLKAMTGTAYYQGVDPLVLDLDGDGLELTGLSSVSPRFDLDGDNFAEATGWVASDDGLLVRDLDGNGTIDDVSELFGSPTTSGFSELALLDSNGDGVISAADASFAQLQIWQDANQDGISQAGELSSVSALGIASISLTSQAPAQSTNAGNVIAADGSFTRTDGSSGSLSDVNFRIDNFLTSYLGDSTVSAAAAAEANVKGRGELADLAIAMTQDATLLQTVQTVMPTLTTPDLGTRLTAHAWGARAAG